MVPDAGTRPQSGGSMSARKTLDHALDAIARGFKARDGVMTRADVRECLRGYPVEVRKAALATVERVAEAEWAGRRGRPMPGDRFYWPARAQRTDQ